MDALVLGKKEGGPSCGESEALKEEPCGEGRTYKLHTVPRLRAHCTEGKAEAQE